MGKIEEAEKRKESKGYVQVTLNVLPRNLMLRLVNTLLQYGPRSLLFLPRNRSGIRALRSRIVTCGFRLV